MPARRIWKGTAALLGAAVVALTLAAAPVAAAPTWLSPTDISAAVPNASGSPSGNIDDPWVGVDAAGDSTAVWGIDADTSTSDAVIQTATRPAGGVWSAPQDLTPTTEASSDPRVAVSPSGDVVAIWKSAPTAGGNGVTRVRVKPAGGDWGPEQTISTPGNDTNDARVVIDPSGNALAAWNDFTDQQIKFATHSGGGAWTAPQPLSAATPQAFDMTLAVNAAGAALAVWRQTDATTKVRNFVAARPAGGSFGPPQAVSAPDRNAGGDPSVALAPDGTGFVAFDQQDGSVFTTWAAVAPPGGSFGTAQELSAPDAGSAVNDPQIAVDASGNAIAEWEKDSGGGHNVLQASFRPAGGAFAPAQNLSDTTGRAIDADLEFSPHGDAFLIWRQTDSVGTGPCVVRSRPSGGDWGAQATVAPTGCDNDVQIRFDAQGDATAAFAFAGSTTQTVEAAGFDAAGPRLDNLAIPASGVAGAPLSFSVSPTDVWSPIASTGFAFGDGSTAGGASATHSYAAAGSFNVTATSTDAVGNQSTATRPVAISAPLPVAPILSGVGESANRWRAGNKLVQTSRKSRRAPIGTTFSFVLNEAAQVRFAFTQRTAGRKAGGKCVAQTKRNRGKRRCTRAVPRGALVFQGHQGANAVRFQGRLSRTRKLKPGRYAVVITATNPAGQQSAASRLSFTVLPH